MKNIFSRILFIALLPGCIVPLSAQKAWLDPGGTDFNPEDSVKICINVAETDRTQLKDFTDDVFLWTWLPTENVGPYKNGSWNASNEEMKMTRQADPNVYCYAMIPTEFYAVGAAEIYENGFAFLAKARDGADLGNGEMKTEDLIIKPEKPGVPKVFTMPAVPKSFKKATDTGIDTLPVTLDDFITILYNNKLETVAGMQNLTASDEIHAFIRITGSDNKIYSNVRKTQVGNDPASQLRAVPNADGLFALTFNLRRLWENSGTTANFVHPPAGERPLRIEVQFARVSPAQPNIDLAPIAEGIFMYYVGRCP
jgi:hypothetical protein